MQFLIIAYDAKDEQAMERRVAARDEHIALSDKLLDEGNGLFSGAILDENGKGIGSIKIVDFETREQFDAYLASDPFVTADVWRDIQVLPFHMGPSYKKLYQGS